ncbi:MAG: hypothetical protein WD638_01270 [Nitriliruptoraceae bacterium]
MERDRSEERDPFAPIEASPRFATPLAVLGGLLGVLAAITGLALVFGPLGMAVALVAHVKGSRLGMPAAVFAAVGMIVGMSITNFLR